MLGGGGSTAESSGGKSLGVKNQGVNAKGETWVRERRHTSTLRTHSYIQQRPQVLACQHKAICLGKHSHSDF